MEFLSRFEDELRCPRCHQLFIDAVLLPCSHSVCLQCAISLASSIRSGLPSLHSNHTTTVGHASSSVYPQTSISATGDDLCGSDDHQTRSSGLQHAATLFRPAVTPSSTSDQVNGEMDRASVGSETDSGVVCTSGGGISTSASSASPCGDNTVASSRPCSYIGADGNPVGVDGIPGGVGAPSVGNLSTTSSQDSASTQSIGGLVVGVNSSGGLVEISCPSCRRPVALVDEPTPAALLAVLSRNRSLEAIVDRYRETRHLPIPCQRCHDDQVTVGLKTEMATLVCEQCVAFYCDRCYEVEHNALEMSQNIGDKHTVMRPAARGKTWLAAVSRGRTVSCPDHEDETLSMHCVTCKIGICCLCASGDHASHQTRPIAAMAKTHKTDLSLLLHTLSEKVKSSTEALQKLKILQDQIDGNSHDLETAVLCQCDMLIEQIERRKNHLVTNIREHRIRKHQSFADQMSESTTRLHRNTGLLQFGIEVLKETDPTAFLLTSRSLMSRVSGVIESLEHELQLEPRVTPQFELSLDTEPASVAIEQMDMYEMKVPTQPSILVEDCVVENNVITVAWLRQVHARIHDNAYILELDDGNEGQFREVYRGTQCACTVEGLHFDAEYRARVKAFNRAGCSDYSKIVRIHTSPVAYFTLDPATAHHDVLFSNDNMTVTSSSFDDRVVLGTVGLSRGIHYWELSIDRYENNKDPAFGIALQCVSRDRMIGKDENGWSMYIDNCRSWFMNDGQHTDRTPGGITVGSVVGVQLDLGRRTLSFYVNGEPQGGAAHSQLPTGAVFYPAISLNRNVQVTLISGLPPITLDTE